MTTLSANIPAALTEARNISLTTFRRDGSRVATPVWFGATDGKLYVITAAESFKVRRLRHDPRVTVASCTRLGRVTGPEHSGTARVLELSEAPEVHAAVTRRYGLQSSIFQWMNRRKGEENVLVEVALDEAPS